MPRFVLDFQSEIETLNKTELADALEDARLRAVVSGVKLSRPFWNVGAIGANAASFQTPVNMVQSGYVWTIMAIGIELSASAAVRAYYGNYSGTINGANRLAATWGANTAASWNSFSKGQLMLPAGEQITLVPAAAQFILSVQLVAIEIPAERIGELLI